MNIRFEKATQEHLPIIFAWLQEPHVREFWDNSQEHKDDIVNFTQGRNTPSRHFHVMFTYWVGFIEHEPFAFLLTSPIAADDACPEIWKNHLSQTGTTHSIDFCIGNKKFLGSGLAAPTLKAFTEFFASTVDPRADTFFIDPDENNPRARHVYEKAGFREVGGFEAQKGFFQGQKSYLMVLQTHARA